MSTTARALASTGRWLDDRFRGARGGRALLRRIFPDHWSFLLGEIALYTFVILLLTGTLLTLFFKPSMTEVVYHGSYTKLNGVRMSEAYASTLNISFDVRGGLLIRQIHHWASDLFMAAIMAHMLRIFFTGGYRKPREINWLIGIVLFLLSLGEALFGNWLPGDLLSGSGVRVMQSVLLSVPVAGTYLSFFAFGGPYPGHDIIPRLYIVHVLLLPGLLLALITAHLFITYRQKHTQVPGPKATGRNVVGVPAYPYFMARTGAFSFFVFAVTALLATFAQINPVWLYGPYDPASASAGSGPEFYMGMLEGAVRAMPAWNWNVAGHTVALSVLLPALSLPAFLAAAAAWPFIEQWITGDQAEHHLLDRPRNAPARTAIGVAAVTFYGVLWAEAGNDIIAHYLNISLYAVTWTARIACIAGPVAAYIITKRICLGLQRRDLHMLQRGVETGIIRQLPSGEYIEETRPLSAEERAIVADGRAVALPAAQSMPKQASHGKASQIRAKLNRIMAEAVPHEISAADRRDHGTGHAGAQHPGADASRPKARNHDNQGSREPR